jgi:hypothetical protein
MLCGGRGVGDGCSVRLVVRVDVPVPPTVVCAVPGRSTAAALSRTGRHYPENELTGEERAPVNHIKPRLNMELDLQSLFGLLCTAVLIG